MAIVNTKSQHAGKQPSAPLIAMLVSSALDNSYPEGGYPFDAGTIARDLMTGDKVPTAISVKADPQAGFSFLWDRTNLKLKVLESVLGFTAL